MTGQLFLQNVIAIIWDFDKTLIPGYMQVPLFKRYAVDEVKFWSEVNALPQEYLRRGTHRASRDSLYLNHMLAYVRAGVFKGLTNATLHKLGEELELYPGLPDFFEVLKKVATSDDRYRRHEISVEHYVVSTGLRAMIEGSKIVGHVEGIWACEFVEGSPAPGFLDEKQAMLLEVESVITDIAYAIDNTSKTRAVFEINKGTNKLDDIDVNASIAHTDRRVPFQNMIYVADGPSDIPVFSIVNQYGGKTFAVYQAGSVSEFRQVNSLQEQGRVQSFGEASYTPGSQTYMWLTNAVQQIADRIVHDREQAIGDMTGKPPQHILE
ncbi:MAG: HAD family hydrolase [Bacillota bacterium]|nr:HAD family hydrolase [Bacillota bacterium]